MKISNLGLVLSYGIRWDRSRKMSDRSLQDGTRLAELCPHLEGFFRCLEGVWKSKKHFGSKHYQDFFRTKKNFGSKIFLARNFFGP